MTELVVTFNRNLTNSEKTSFHATLLVEEQGGNEREYTLAYSGNYGYVSYNQEANGSFVISGNTLTITMNSSVGFLDFTLG